MPDHSRRARLRAAAPLAAFALLMLSPAASGAQTPTQRERDAKINDMRMRQLAMRDLERLKNPPPAKAPARASYREVAQDFEHLQRENYALAGAAAHQAPDYALVRKHAGEVRKRALRLKGYLSLPKVEDEEVVVRDSEIPTPSGLKAAVASLDALVNRFAWNPVFRRPDVVDLEQSTKASRDLSAIISLSERVRRRAEELSKAGKR
jgi:hypothetical protein